MRMNTCTQAETGREGGREGGKRAGSEREREREIETKREKRTHTERKRNRERERDKERERERKREEQRARKEKPSPVRFLRSSFNGGFRKQRSLLRAGKMYFPKFLCGATEESKRREGGKNFREYIFRRSYYTSFVSLSNFHSLFVNVCFTTKVYVKCHVRIANRLGEDSYCRGGIVHIRNVCSRVP